MATLSFADLKNTALPDLWDAGEITKVRLADGVTFEQMLRDIRLGLQALNAGLLAMAHYGDLIAVQDTPEVEYPIGVSNGVEEATEYGVPTPMRGETTGHMLPLKAYYRALGWTMMYLRNARTAKLDADVRSAITDMRSAWQKHLLERFFKMEGETVGSTSNASVPFADGGVTDSSYVPPVSPEGEVFTSSHDHYLRLDTLNDAALGQAVEHLQEHGHQAPFDVIASRTDASTWKGFTNYKAPEWPGVVYRATTDRAAIPDITDYFGYVETAYGICRLWLTPRLPTSYFGVFKTYGPGDPRNPLRLRINPNVGFGWQIVPGVWVSAPQTMAVMYAEYGVGVGEDRTNGVCVYINATGDYVTPTIS